MAHELSITADGRAEMFSGNNKVPWHGLGEVVEGTLSSSAAIKAAHLDWSVDLRPCQTADAVAIPGYWASVRTDTNAPLGVVQGRYNPIQNVEAFDFMDSLVGEGKMTYETAGALRGGKVVWIMAKYNGPVKLGGDDHKHWCLLVTSHNGSKPLSVQWVSERVVCANTLSIALAGKQNSMTIRHSKRWKDKADQARQVLGLTEAYFSALKERVDRMVEQAMSEMDVHEFTIQLLPQEGAELPKQRATARAEIVNLFSRGAGNRGKTRWDALCAVTDYADHVLPMRGVTTRLETAVMGGSGTALKQRAYDLLAA